MGRFTEVKRLAEGTKLAAMFEKRVKDISRKWSGIVQAEFEKQEPIPFSRPAAKKMHIVSG